MVMLREIWIRQFAIIEELQIQFGEGFHVLTGETGAGKSILIDALALLVGGRASSDYVRYGAEKAEIEATFELPADHPLWEQMNDWGLSDEEGILLIRREITVQGKSYCRLNGRMATVAMLRTIGPYLLDICGQHEHQSLLKKDEQLRFIDQLAGESLPPLMQEYQQQFQQYQAAKKELRQWSFSDEEVERKIDLYQFQQREIDEARLTEIDWQELEQEQRRLSHAEKLLANASSAYQQLNGEQKVLDQLHQVLSSLREIAALDESAAAMEEVVQGSLFQLEEVVRQLSDYQELLEFDPERLNEIEEQLHRRQQLERKYGETIEEILAYRERIVTELEQLMNHEERVAACLQKIEQCERRLTVLADQLTRLRKQAASRLESQIERELSDLQMESTVFHIAFLPSSGHDSFKPHGVDEIEFRIAPNPGEPLKPLAKIASGGELSRIMLALKSVFSDQRHQHTLIFDEIDTGVSGRAAQAIAEKIATLTEHYQLFAVTHLPQVASMADHHFSIYKVSDGERTQTQVKKLTGGMRIREIARILGGVQVTAKTEQHAEEMLELARQVKQTRSSRSQEGFV
jgi:DNA repair protein RecN (Recombination protein N)